MRLVVCDSGLTPDVGHMLGQAEEAEHYPHQTNGPDLDIAPGGEAHPEASCPLVLARPEVGGQVLRLGLDLLKTEEQQVWPRVTTEEATEVIATGELCPNIPSDHLKIKTIREKIAMFIFCSSGSLLKLETVI